MNVSIRFFIAVRDDPSDYIFYPGEKGFAQPHSLYIVLSFGKKKKKK